MEKQDIISATLDQAAYTHYSNGSQADIGSGARAKYEDKNDSFKAGAAWQKKRYNELITLMRQLIAAYDFRYPYAKQLLAGYTNEEAFAKLNMLIEQVQD